MIPIRNLVPGPIFYPLSVRLMIVIDLFKANGKPNSPYCRLKDKKGLTCSTSETDSFLVTLSKNIERKGKCSGESDQFLHENKGVIFSLIRNLV